jgi:ketosteroid isomerase-like protein
MSGRPRPRPVSAEDPEGLRRAADEALLLEGVAELGDDLAAGRDDPPEALARRWSAAFNARDEAALLALAHPDIVLRPLRIVPRREYRGHDGVRAWLDDIRRFSDARAQVVFDRVERVGPGEVAAHGTMADETPVVVLFSVRDGRITAARGYFSDADLLEQLGTLER